jgi:hypothetical protein
MSNWHPERIPIMREEDYHTHYLGRVEDGRLFFGYETFVFPKGYSGENWQNERLEYAVVYLFDHEGNHIETLYELVGKTCELQLGQSELILKALLKPLGKLNFRAIEVKPFSTTIDGIEFGLIPNDETQSIELQPSSTIAFIEPWDGEYDT